MRAADAPSPSSREGSMETSFVLPASGPYAAAAAPAAAHSPWTLSRRTAVGALMLADVEGELYVYAQIAVNAV